MAPSLLLALVGGWPRLATSTSLYLHQIWLKRILTSLYEICGEEDKVTGRSKGSSLLWNVGKRWQDISGWESSAATTSNLIYQLKMKDFKC